MGEVDVLSFEVWDEFKEEKLSIYLKLGNMDVGRMHPSGTHERTWAGWGYLPAWLVSPSYAAATITALIEEEKLDGHRLNKDESGKLFMGPPSRINDDPVTQPDGLFSYMYNEGELAQYEVLNSVFHLRRPSDNREVLEIVADSAHVKGEDGSPLCVMIDKATLACPTGPYKARELHLPHVDTMEASLRVSLSCHLCLLQVPAFITQWLCCLLATGLRAFTCIRCKCTPSWFMSWGLQSPVSALGAVTHILYRCNQLLLLCSFPPHRPTDSRWHMVRSASLLGRQVQYGLALTSRKRS